jgi:hypothetical protein
MDAYSRHIQLINNYRLYYPGSTKTLVRDSSKDKGVFDVIKASFYNHVFIYIIIYFPGKPSIFMGH